MAPDADSQKSRIFIVDDHPLVREWLATLINQQSDLMVCGDAGNAADGLKLIASAKPHAAVVDISMDGGSGIELIKQMTATCPEVAVIVLSVHDEVLYRERALRAGARGYVMKREATKNVLQAIRCVLEGKLYLTNKMDRVISGEIGQGSVPGKSSPVELLSDRELEVFQLLGRGLGTRQIADELHVGFRTVQTFRGRIKEKLKLSTATELLRAAMRWHDDQRLK
jgi:DNA-binding NarL/FixJ family response regulator